MTRARRLRRRAPLTPGIDARHRREAGARRRRGARRGAPHPPARRLAPESPTCMPAPGPRYRPPASTTPPDPAAGPEQGSAVE
jgi:hypothetical protein